MFREIYTTVCQFLDAKGGCVGFGLLATNFAVHTWADVYRWLTGWTGVCAAVIATHGAVRIVYRAVKGLPFINPCSIYSDDRGCALLKEIYCESNLRYLEETL
jgi:hypothetical protein